MRFVIVATFCAYAQLLCVLFFAQSGEGKSARTHVAEWLALLASLVLGFAVTTGAYLHTITPAECFGGWPYGHVDCAELMRTSQLSQVLFGMLPLMLIVFLAFHAMTRTGLYLFRRCFNETHNS